MKTAGDAVSIIKAAARRIGFDQAGVTKLEALAEGERAVRKWVEEGRHGGMKYLEDFDKRRERFFAEFPNARSVIVLGVNYFSREKSKRPGEMKTLAGRVARYAWGRDYHEVLSKKHALLIAELETHFGRNFRAKSCVDIRPIPERFAAVKAGLGFIGKHTGLLSQKFGPWLFLSEILTNLDLEADLPAEGDCGSCDHCQTICPTGALDRDYNIDARLCIAYLTIEHKGVIARELRPKIKDWIFGCDECLAVCPFTSKSAETSWKEFYPEQGKGEALPMDTLFEISSNREYEKLFRGTALLRAGRKQMLRNACIVLGNSCSPEAIPYLEKALRDPSELVRLHASWALGRIQEKKAKELLTQQLSQEENSEVRAEILAALSS